MKIIDSIAGKISALWKQYDRLQRHSSVELLEWEAREIQNIFGLVLFGFIVGIPSAPMNITLDLLPHMQEELHIMLEKIDTAHDPLAELFSLLDIG